MDFAILQKSKVIAIIGIFPSNWQQFEEVVICHRNVKIGDDYILGNFYRDGVYVDSPQEAENLQESAALIDEMESICNDLIGE